MTQLPLLISELIGWYIWKAKIKECNKEYHKIVELYDYDDGEMYRWTVIYNDTMEKHKNPLLYRDLSRPIIHPDYWIYNFTCSICSRVADLPQRYFYSGGLNNGNGFYNQIEKIKKYKKVNSWLFRK